MRNLKCWFFIRHSTCTTKLYDTTVLSSVQHVSPSTEHMNTERQETVFVVVFRINLGRILWLFRGSRLVIISRRMLTGTYLLTYLLTSWCRVLLETLTSLKLVKKFPAFHGNRKFITALKTSATFLHPGSAQFSPYTHIPPPGGPT